MNSHQAHRSHDTRPRRGSVPLLLGIGLAATLVTGAAARQDAHVAASPPAPPAAATCVPNEQDGSCLPIAPDSARVDLAMPSFSHPTEITNPHFPINDLVHVIQLGVDGPETLRVEATLLPETKAISWNGHQVETVVSQFIAYKDGRVVETANDFFAQADDGSVWYFGEDVLNYEDGAIVDTHGTWLAGHDGPPGMIMPANPRAGDVYRPENVPSVVFEQSTIIATGETVIGPRGPVAGAIIVQELGMDGVLETKAFAPGYGEFSAETGEEHYVVALSVPLDVQPGAVPTHFVTVSTGAASIFGAAPTGDWAAISTTLDTMVTAWEASQPTDAPPALHAQMENALATLTTAVAAQDSGEVRQAAINVGHASLDLQLQHRDLAEIDLARLGLWADQSVLDAESANQGAMAGDVVVIETIRDRVGHSLAPDTAAVIETQAGALRAAVDRGDLSAAGEIAMQLGDLVPKG